MAEDRRRKESLQRKGEKWLFFLTLSWLNPKTGLHLRNATSQELGRYSPQRNVTLK